MVECFTLTLLASELTDSYIGSSVLLSPYVA